MPTDTEIIDKLKLKFGPLNSHPLFPLLDWRYAVCSGATRAGYWEWVLIELRAEFENRKKKEVNP